MRDQRDADQRQNTGGDQALVERTHDRLAGAELDEEGARNRRQDADTADGERIDHHRAQDRLAGEEDRGKDHGRDRRHCVGFEQVGRHAGAVADIVADVVGDGRGIARIVLRDPGFDLADEIPADVGALGEDAAAEAREDRDQRRAEAECDKRVDNNAAIGCEPQRAGEDGVIDGDAEQCEAGDQHAGDRAGLEGEFQSAGERRDRSLCGADIRAHRDIHADEAGHARQNRADRESDRHKPAEQQADDHEDHDADDADGGVLALEIGLRALAHGRGDLLHLCRAGVRLHDGPRGPDAVNDGKQTAGDDHPQSCH